MYVVTLGLLNDDDDIVVHIVSKSYFGEICILSILVIFTRTLIKLRILGWVNSSVGWVVNGCKELVA